VLGEHLLQRLEPFIYRRHLDYAAVEDIKLMKQKIDRSLARERGARTKLGGRYPRNRASSRRCSDLRRKNPHLRERNSLRRWNCCAPMDRRSSATNCGLPVLRTVEHRIQVVQERQTHNLPTRPEECPARRCGFDNAAAPTSARNPPATCDDHFATCLYQRGGTARQVSPVAFSSTRRPTPTCARTSSRRRAFATRTRPTIACWSFALVVPAAT
jgi:hypothetical protein